MPNIPLTFLPPQHWQDLQKMLRGIVDVIWKEKGWHEYGRTGQSQNGIDLFGYDLEDKLVGIQCKRKNLTDPDGQLLGHSLLQKPEIDKEIALIDKAKTLRLDKLIFATTSATDKNIQDIVLEINTSRRKKKKFSVQIWFWDDIQVHIERHEELQYWYYQDYLEKIHKYDKNIHIIQTLKRAFLRPAFDRHIHREESGGDFLQAIKDTMEVITTGNLYNRRGDLIASSRPYDSITNQNWKKSIKSIYRKLDKIRDIYQQGTDSKSIVEYPTCIEILDNRISESLNQYRKECLEIMNAILNEVGIEKIDSELCG